MTSDIKLFSLPLKNLTEESKKEQDEKLWSEWTEKHIEGLHREVISDIDIETQSQNRMEKMNQVNPR